MSALDALMAEQQHQLVAVPKGAPKPRLIADPAISVEAIGSLNRQYLEYSKTRDL